MSDDADKEKADMDYINALRIEHPFLARWLPPKEEQPFDIESLRLPDDYVTKSAPPRPDEQAFLESFEWRRARYETLKRYGSRCAACGRTPRDGVWMNVDHILPRKTHPELALDLSNLQVLCNECNHGKGNSDHTDWRGKF